MNCTGVYCPWCDAQGATQRVLVEMAIINFAEGQTRWFFYECPRCGYMEIHQWAVLP